MLEALVITRPTETTAVGFGTRLPLRVVTGIKLAVAVNGLFELTVLLSAGTLAS